MLEAGVSPLSRWQTTDVLRSPVAGVLSSTGTPNHELATTAAAKDRIVVLGDIDALNERVKFAEMGNGQLYKLQLALAALQNSPRAARQPAIPTLLHNQSKD